MSRAADRGAERIYFFSLLVCENQGVDEPGFATRVLQAQAMIMTIRELCITKGTEIALRIASGIALLLSIVVAESLKQSSKQCAMTCATADCCVHCIFVTS